MLTGRQFSAQEAKTWGSSTMWSRLRTLERFTREYAPSHRQRAAHHARREAHYPRGAEEGLRRRALQDLGQECFESEDYAEGRKAFMEKRKAVFRGNDMRWIFAFFAIALATSALRRQAFRASR